MVTPVGLSARQTAASVRSGIGRLAESWVSDREGNPLVMGLADDQQLPELVESLADHRLGTRHERLIRLGGTALAEALSPSLSAPPAAPVPLLLGVAEPRSEARETAGTELFEALAAQAAQPIDIARSKLFPHGRAAGLLALDHAMTMLDQRLAPLVLVGAVDSYLDVGLLEALDREGRLRSGEISDGFVPGEGAAFVLLAPSRSGRHQGQPALARIVGAAVACEPGHLYSREPYRGEGLSATFRALFDSVANEDGEATVGRAFLGFNGESFWAKEWGVAQMRSSHHFADALRVVHPADCMGDPGAALGLVLVGLAALDLARGQVTGRCLVSCSSDGEERAAALLTPARAR
jgi:3-oxoacyl-[acyl-carrier-protein] synthase-1